MKHLVVSLLALTFLALAACNPHASVQPEAPLKTSGKALPTQQCQELRKQGGKC